MEAMISLIPISMMDLVRSIRFADVADIMILSLVIYKLLWFLHKTSSGRVMRGLLILLIAMGATSTFSMYALSFLLNKALEWGIVALVVLFQPEIRRFLEQMGSSRLGLDVFSPFSQPKNLQSVELCIVQTVEAYTTMSRDKVGALMVFERNNLLDDVVNTGTSLDCAVSAELLKNIFWNKAPLHDGAVVVRDGRIIGAGCMLPLSANVNLSRDLGMRHRAGIGISEHSDSIVVLVSEETGSISAAVGGMLKRHLAPETLERLLRNELLQESKVEQKPSTFAMVSNFLKKNRKEDS